MRGQPRSGRGGKPRMFRSSVVRRARVEKFRDDFLVVSAGRRNKLEID